MVDASGPVDFGIILFLLPDLQPDRPDRKGIRWRDSAFSPFSSRPPRMKFQKNRGKCSSRTVQPPDRPASVNPADLRRPTIVGVPTRPKPTCHIYCMTYAPMVSMSRAADFCSVQTSRTFPWHLSPRQNYRKPEMNGRDPCRLVGAMATHL